MALTSASGVGVVDFHFDVIGFKELVLKSGGLVSMGTEYRSLCCQPSMPF